MLYVKKPVALTTLRKIPIAPVETVGRPERGKNTPSKGEDKTSWVGLKHHTMLDVLIKTLKQEGYIVSNTMASLYYNDAEMAASVDVEHKRLPAHYGFIYSVGCFNSNMHKSLPKIYGGLRLGVLKDSPGLALMEWKLSKRTRYLNVEEEIATAIKEYPGGDYVALYQELRKTELSEERWNSLIARCARKKLIPWARLGLLEKLYKKSGDLPLAYATVIQQSPPHRQLAQMKGFVEMLKYHGQKNSVEVLPGNVYPSKNDGELLEPDKVIEYPLRFCQD